MTSRFTISASPSPSRTSISSQSTDEDDLSNLPFPQPLNRSLFLSPTFTPSAFLSSLTSRFQTLEDLRLELSTLSQRIESELVDLVNNNYADFLSLGGSLQGGEERVEEIRVGVLGFERDVRALRERVNQEREKLMEGLAEKRRVMREMEVGRGLLRVERLVRELEGELGLKERERVADEPKEDEEDEDSEDEIEKTRWSAVWDEVDDADDDEDYGTDEGAVPTRLKAKIEKFLTVRLLCERFGKDHPFLVAEHNRIRKVKETVLLDIDAAIRAETSVKGKQAILRYRSEIQD